MIVVTPSTLQKKISLSLTNGIICIYYNVVNDKSREFENGNHNDTVHKIPLARHYKNHNNQEIENQNSSK